jgi:hypothetical protein
MKTRTISLALGLAALGLAAGCSSGTSSSAANASPTGAVASVLASAAACNSSGGSWDGSTCQPSAPPNPFLQTDPNGQQCASLDSQGYCPGDDPPQQTDPNGQQCASLDSQGYCPGDDPQQTDPNGNTCASLDSQGYCPGHDPQPDKVTFIVSGSYASVTYGPAGSNYTGSVPMDVTETIPGQPPIYYAIDAQLQGGGTVSCKIEVNGQTISQGTAQGGYNIATCEISQDPLSGGWTDTNSS